MRPLRILSSDDDEGIRTLLFSLLTEHGHTVEFARNSDEVFKSLGRSRYDLLILDVNTPGINGYKVAEKITNNIINRPKILIFTARNTAEEQFQYVSSGADAVIQKGAPCDVIIQTINDLYGQDTATPPGPDNIKEPPSMPEPVNIHEEVNKKINEDLKYCITKIVHIEDDITLKNLRYEGFIRDLLKEKQRTEKNYLEFKRIEDDVLKLKSLGYAVAATAVLAVLKAFF